MQGCTRGLHSQCNVKYLASCWCSGWTGWVIYKQTSPLLFVISVYMCICNLINMFIVIIFLSIQIRSFNLGRLRKTVRASLVSQSKWDKYKIWDDEQRGVKERGDKPHKNNLGYTAVRMSHICKNLNKRRYFRVVSLLLLLYLYIYIPIHLCVCVCALSKWKLSWQSYISNDFL